MKKNELPEYLHKTLKNIGGSGTLIDVCKEFYSENEQELQNSGDLFYTWQYDIRWAATALRKNGIMLPAKENGGAWTLAEDVAKEPTQSNTFKRKEPKKNYISSIPLKMWNGVFTTHFYCFQELNRGETDEETVKKLLSEESGLTEEECRSYVAKAMEVFERNEEYEELKKMLYSDDTEEERKEKIRDILCISGIEIEEPEESDNEHSDNITEIVDPSQFEGKEGKEKAIAYLEEKGVKLAEPITFSKRNISNNEYWANPQPEFTRQDWSLILNDRQNRQFIVMNIKRNTLNLAEEKQPGLIMRDDKDVIVLKLHAETLIDKKSGIDFNRFIIKKVRY